MSKLLGISVRFLMVCLMIQLAVFDPLGVPYIFSVIFSVSLIWLTTYKGGVKSVIWGDALKSFCLLSTVILCLYFVSREMNLGIGALVENVATHPDSRIFFLDDPSGAKYFWKQIVAGIFLVVAMTGLDQDMMQRTLACRNAGDSRKNLVVSSLLQTFVISLLLVLGVTMILYVESKGIAVPEKTDNLFATIAFHGDIPLIVGALFVLGLVSTTYSSVGSALTAMTTTMTVDILEVDKKESDRVLGKKRKWIHTLISVAMAILVICFFYLDSEDAISMVYRLVSYSDGPILGLFLFGILTKRNVNERWLPLVCLLAPVGSWAIQWSCREFAGYEIGFELLIINAALTMGGMWLLSVARREEVEPAV